MKSGTDSDDIARLRTLFAAEREASFADFAAVYCVDAADDVLARFARARRGDPEAALAFLREDYEWRKAEDAVALRSTPPADVLGHDPAVLAEYYRHDGVRDVERGVVAFITERSAGSPAHARTWPHTLVVLVLTTLQSSMTDANLPMRA